MPKIRLQHVAEKAGVSIATVDRVINQRPGVRPATAEKVQAVIRELKYTTGGLDSHLGFDRVLRFGFVLPIGSNVFMQGIEDQLRVVSDHFHPDRVQITTYHADVFDGLKLASFLEKLDDDLDGLAVVALDHPAVREAIDHLVDRDIHVVTLVSDLPASKRCRYIGIDNHAAGRTAATMLGRFVVGRSGTVGVVAGSLSLRDHAERKFGFEQVLAEDFPHLTILPAVEGYDQDDRAQEATAALLKAHPDMLGLYSVGAGNGGVIRALEESGRTDLVVVVHELTTESRRALLRGTLDAVINQDAGHEVRSALRVLMSVSDGKPIVPGQERIRIDIFLRDNVPAQA